MKKHFFKDIIFINVNNVLEEFSPKPASEFVPDWYKKLESYSYNGSNEKVPTEKGSTPATIKKCIPVFDSITCGYIITSFCDIFVGQIVLDSPEDLESTFIKNKEYLGKKVPYYSWPSGEPINFHDAEQALNYPMRNNMPSYPKWINPWGIKTPPGYSTLFIPPVHRESMFTILPGIVDTDKYITNVNFPFILNDPNFEGLIPAGTPIAQVIPFKRDSWKMSIGTEKDIEDCKKVNKQIRNRFWDGYKNIFRVKKDYR